MTLSYRELELQSPDYTGYGQIQLLIATAVSPLHAEFCWLLNSRWPSAVCPFSPIQLIISLLHSISFISALFNPFIFQRNFVNNEYNTSSVFQRVCFTTTWCDVLPHHIIILSNYYRVDRCWALLTFDSTKACREDEIESW